MPPEDNIFQADPTGTAPATVLPAGGTEQPPGTQTDPVFSQKDVDLAREKARADTLQEMIDKGHTAPKQADPTQNADPYANQPALPDNPLDLLPPAEKQKLIDSAQFDPVGYSNTLATLSSKLTEMKVQRQAAPLIMSQARTVVDLFEDRMSRRETRQDLVPAISREFRTLLVGKDLRPLINLPDGQREEELVLRWETARNRALVAAPTAPVTRPNTDPGLQSPGAGISSPTLKKAKVEDIPGVDFMSKKYKFTPEQLKEIEEYA